MSNYDMCNDDLDLCKRAIMSEKGTKLQAEHIEESLVTKLKDSENLNMEMRPQPVYSKAAKKSPFGNRIPRNYFCHYEYNLDPEITYDVAIKKFFYSWKRYHELIDL